MVVFASIKAKKNQILQLNRKAFMWVFTKKIIQGDVYQNQTGQYLHRHHLQVQQQPPQLEPQLLEQRPLQPLGPSVSMLLLFSSLDFLCAHEKQIHFFVVVKDETK